MLLAWIRSIRISIFLWGESLVCVRAGSRSIFKCLSWGILIIFLYSHSLWIRIPTGAQFGFGSLSKSFWFAAPTLHPFLIHPWPAKSFFIYKNNRVTVVETFPSSISTSNTEQGQTLHRPDVIRQTEKYIDNQTNKLTYRKMDRQKNDKRHHLPEKPMVWTKI